MFQRAFFEFRMFYPDGYMSHKACNKQIARTRREHSERVVLQGSLRLGEEMSMALKHLGKKVAGEAKFGGILECFSALEVSFSCKNRLLDLGQRLVRHYLLG
jgi:hypothetical protein